DVEHGDAYPVTVEEMIQAAAVSRICAFLVTEHLQSRDVEIRPLYRPLADDLVDRVLRMRALLTHFDSLQIKHGECINSSAVTRNDRPAAVGQGVRSAPEDSRIQSTESSRRRAMQSISTVDPYGRSLTSRNVALRS